jgi:hypothetical protein
MANLWYDARDEWNFLFHEHSEVQSLQEDPLLGFLVFRILDLRGSEIISSRQLLTKGND